MGHAAAKGGPRPARADAIESAVAAVDWDRVGEDLTRIGAVRTGPLLSPETCADLRALFDRDARFRKTVTMARHGYGSGTYRYLADPLPETVAQLQAAVYARLAPVANRLAGLTGASADWPGDFAEMATRSAAAGQTAPTPLLLKYGPGDFNCLHQDVYGAVAFPLQLVVSLSSPGEDFMGGEFVVVENRPRRQSTASVAVPALGEGVVFATREAPRRTSKGWSRASLRHGVSAVTKGERMTLGVIFHGATP
ncbi:MAG: 2OG-Fe(II) oxygenase [Pseudomonadota bacterium]